MRYIDADDLKAVIKANDWSNPVVPDVVCLIIDRSLVADVAPKSEVAREIFAEIDEALQYEIDIEDTRGRNAWAQGDVSGFQTHEYAEDKLDTIKIALSLFKKKYTEGAQDENNT